MTRAVRVCVFVRVCVHFHTFFKCTIYALTFVGELLDVTGSIMIMKINVNKLTDLCHFTFAEGSDC